MKFLTYKNLFSFLDNLKNDYEVFVPVKKGDHRFYKKYDTYSSDIVIGEVRAFEALKAFFFRARERVADGFKPDIPSRTGKPLAIVGVKACDLKGFKIQDFVFRNPDSEDPFYSEAREKSLIISADCTCAIETCFCLAMDVTPSPSDEFDINLSCVEGGFVVRTGSEKGEDIIEKNFSLFIEANGQQLSQVEKQKAKVIEEVEKNIQAHGVPHQEKLKGVIQKVFESDLWKEEAKTCVECGSCNTICPTCHCFLLVDQKDGERMARFRQWDSCMLKDFARVAGGDNPRAKLWMRLRNRFEKKFDYFPKVAGVYACTGCGRCISGCPAKIDIRDILEKSVANA